MPADEFKMLPSDFQALRDQAADIRQSDSKLGRFLDLLVLHLGHAHGLDPVAEDARLAAEARVTAREEEDARLAAEADERAKARALEDAQPLPSTPVESRAAARAAEDKVLQDAADERARIRAEEDEQAKALAEGGPAPVVQPVPVVAPFTQEGVSDAN